MGCALRDPVAHAAHLELENWAHAYAGGIGTELRRVDPTPTPDAVAAHQVEQALLVMKDRRADLFALVMAMYRDRLQPEQIAARLHMHERAFRRARTRAYRWLRQHLDAQRGAA